jgi:hypothetical protein
VRELPELAHRRGHDQGYWCPTCNYVTTRPPVAGTLPVACPYCPGEPMRLVWTREPA